MSQQCKCMQRPAGGATCAVVQQILVISEELKVVIHFLGSLVIINGIKIKNCFITACDLRVNKKLQFYFLNPLVSSINKCSQLNCIVELIKTGILSLNIRKYKIKLIKIKKINKNQKNQ